jgi:hypothetical protein
MKKRLIKEMIFCGTPEVYFQGLGKLHAQINRALSLISALQQPAHSPDEITAATAKYEEEWGWGEVLTCVEDIMCALLGPEYHVERHYSKEEIEKMIADSMAKETAKDIEEQEIRGLGMIGAAMDDEIARQDKLASDPYSIYAHHRCMHQGCEARAEYITCDGFGRMLLICEHHYNTTTCDNNFSHCPPGRK